MSDEYPTEEVLDTVRAWPREKGWPALLEYVKASWWAADWGWTQEDETYHISTGGWSGNESLIEALRKNWAFWAECWLESRRGGHFVFLVP